MSDILTVAGLKAGYGPIEVLHGIDFTVGDGEIVVILGANGAGKTTTMRAVSGTIQRTGSVRFDGTARDCGSPRRPSPPYHDASRCAPR